MSDIYSIQANKAFLRSLFDTAVATAQPAVCIPQFIPKPPKGRTIVIGAGKASAAMAQVFEQAWEKAGYGELSGTVVTRYGYAKSCQQIEILEASHPVPDAAGVAASRKILGTVADLTVDDLVVVLISGGGSALLCSPAKGISLEDKMALNQLLLDSGAPISAINCVRKHVSAIKGGRLALAASPAKVITLAISDVPGDDPAMIASGPTVPDPTTREEALAIIDQYQIQVPDSIQQYLRSEQSETPKPENLLFEQCETQIIAAPVLALQKVAELARAKGYQVKILGDALEGEAREVARVHAQLARHAPVKTLLLSGGELTVTQPGNGRGGPNTEYALALAYYLNGLSGVTAIACDTDGIDGSEDNAGAMIDETTLQRAKHLDLSAEDYLQQHDSWQYFKVLDDLVMTGPTYTNINDFRAIMID